MKLIEPITLIPVTPSGTSHGIGCTFDKGGSTGCKIVASPSYPRSILGELLRAYRVARKLNLREAGEALGISIIDYSGLERGHYTLSHADWPRAMGVIHPGTIPWFTAELAEGIEQDAAKSAPERWTFPSGAHVQFGFGDDEERVESTTADGAVASRLRAHTEEDIRIQAMAFMQGIDMTTEQSEASGILLQQKYGLKVKSISMYNRSFRISTSVAEFGPVNQPVELTSVDEVRLQLGVDAQGRFRAFIQPLEPRVEGDDMFLRYQTAGEHDAFKLPPMLRLSGDFNRAAAETHLEYIAHQRHAAIEAADNALDIIAPTIDDVIESIGEQHPDMVHWRRASELIAEGKLDEADDVIQNNVDIDTRPPQTPFVIRVMMQLMTAGKLVGWSDSDEPQREEHPPEPVCTCVLDEPVGPLCKRAFGRKHGGKPHCPKPCGECSDGAHHFTEIGTVVAFGDDEVAGDSPEDIAENKRHQSHPAALVGCHVWHECYHCGAWMEFDDGDEDDDDDFDDDDFDENGDIDFSHNEPENLRQPTLIPNVVFEDEAEEPGDTNAEPPEPCLCLSSGVVFGPLCKSAAEDVNGILQFLKHGGPACDHPMHSIDHHFLREDWDREDFEQRVEQVRLRKHPAARAGCVSWYECGHCHAWLESTHGDRSHECDEGCKVEDLDAVSGGAWHCGKCGRFIEEHVVRTLLDIGAEVVPAPQPDPCDGRHLAGVRCENKFGHRQARDPFEHVGMYKGTQVFWDGAFSSLRRCWTGEVVAAPPGVFGGGDLPTWEAIPELQANDNMLPESIHEHFRQDGSLWAYELAEAIVKHVSRIGFVKHDIGLETALMWYGAVLQWPSDVVAEAQAWLKLKHDVDQPQEIPQAVKAIVDQELAMQQADDLGESRWTECANQIKQ